MVVLDVAIVNIGPVDHQATLGEQPRSVLLDERVEVADGDEP
ncbi:hypothetical protein [Kribbella steppae]|nr:hypothetical protein [Kribbella steppae]